jgi:hypothetical protein
LTRECDDRTVERSARSVDVRLDDRQVGPEPRQEQREEIRMLHDLVRNSIVTAANSRAISPSGKWVMAGWCGPTPLEQQPRDVVILEGRQADEQLPGVRAASDDPAANGSVAHLDCLDFLRGLEARSIAEPAAEAGRQHAQARTLQQIADRRREAEVAHDLEGIQEKWDRRRRRAATRSSSTSPPSRHGRARRV